MEELELKDRYYIPSIEEFYLGFEFEWKRDFEEDTEWKKCEYNPTMYFLYKEGSEVHDFFYKEKDGKGEWIKSSIDDVPMNSQVLFLLDKPKHQLINIRVKYLDREDIESLGFIKTTENWNDYWNNFIQEFDWGVIKIRVHEKNRTKLLIYCLSKDNSSRCLFEGIIKNKSELKVLLKQLGIYEN